MPDKLSIGVVDSVADPSSKEFIKSPESCSVLSPSKNIESPSMSINSPPRGEMSVFSFIYLFNKY